MSNFWPELQGGWKKELAAEFNKDYMLKLKAFLQQQNSHNKSMLPEPEFWFNALTSCDLEQVKVIILGQDPYPTPGHAHGLCFSVRPEVQVLPKSLKNIFKELNDDLAIENTTGNLQHWAEQGVLLLNSVLTVQAGQANAHQGQGWEKFTDRIIELLNKKASPMVFVLWGAYAQKKGRIVTNKHHLIIQSPHPSPLSAYRGFYGSQPFSAINVFLQQNNQAEIDWSV